MVIRTFTERADSRVKEDKGDWDWIEVTCLFGEMPFQAKKSLCCTVSDGSHHYSAVYAAGA
ncbi:MAG: hypothetical protein J6Y64_01335, partial [Ruminococcus sp.]|nr:hypothetical protein [Ruminococcus sp.]